MIVNDALFVLEQEVELISPGVFLRCLRVAVSRRAALREHRLKGKDSNLTAKNHAGLEPDFRFSLTWIAESMCIVHFLLQRRIYLLQKTKQRK